MSEDLGADGTGSIDFNGHTGHLKRTPVPFFDEVLNQPCVFGIFLIARITYASAIDADFFCVGGNGD